MELPGAGCTCRTSLTLRMAPIRDLVLEGGGWVLDPPTVETEPHACIDPEYRQSPHGDVEQSGWGTRSSSPLHVPPPLVKFREVDRGSPQTMRSQSPRAALCTGSLWEIASSQMPALEEAGLSEKCIKASAGRRIGTSLPSTTANLCTLASEPLTSFHTVVAKVSNQLPHQPGMGASLKSSKMTSPLALVAFPRSMDFSTTV
mmetsp:Transcript_11378/g.31663  ORF Transcript_11378/g.31663 Transcript_11378/m.31663 type:complete len:202 (-) Transcript_11378:2865-3470(-)